MGSGAGLVQARAEGCVNYSISSLVGVFVSPVSGDLIVEKTRNTVTNRTFTNIHFPSFCWWWGKKRRVLLIVLKSVCACVFSRFFYSSSTTIDSHTPHSNSVRMLCSLSRARYMFLRRRLQRRLARKSHRENNGKTKRKATNSKEGIMLFIEVLWGGGKHTRSTDYCLIVTSKQLSRINTETSAWSAPTTTVILLPVSYSSML